MPDPSADRPPTPPEQLFSEADVALVDETIDAWFSDMMLDCWPNFEPAARLVLTALASAGRLLPVDAEHREHEFTVEYVHPMDRQYRRQRMEPCMDTLAEVTEYADGLRTVGYIDVKVFRRTRAVDAGRWVEVDPDA